MTKTEESVRRFLAGEEAAFAGLVREWEGRIFNLAWRYLGNREDAQDAAQETFLSVFRSLRSLRDPKTFPAWLFRIALNHCRARWRSRPPGFSLEGALSSEEECRSSSFTESRAGSDAAVLAETRDLLRKSLLGLSDDHRTAIILKEYMGLSLEEVAQIMDCPLSTAKSRLYHGLRGVQRNIRRLGLQPPNSD